MKPTESQKLVISFPILYNDYNKITYTQRFIFDDSAIQARREVMLLGYIRR